MSNSLLPYDEKGNIIWPEPLRKQREKRRMCKVRREREEALMKNFDKRIIISYNGWGLKGWGLVDNKFECNFEIECPNEIINKKILEAKDSADRKVNLKSHADINIKNDAKSLILSIAGLGKDERCTWCRTFRTILRSYLVNLKYAIYQKGRCKFE